METPKPLPAAEDKKMLKEQLDELEVKLTRQVVAVQLTKTAGDPVGINVAQVLGSNVEAPKLKRFIVEEVPAAAQSDPEAFRGFVAPLLENAELIDRTIVQLGTTETQVVILRELPDLVMPSGDGILRGDGTWPWFAEIDGRDIVVRDARTTVFGGDDDPQDSGETASGVRTKGNPSLEGCSLPMRYNGLNERLRAALGGSPIPRVPFGLLRDGRINPNGTRVRVTDPGTNTSIEVPVIDVGPAKRTGNPLDLTVAAARKFNSSATARNFAMRLNFRILGGAQFVSAAEVTAVLNPATGTFPQRVAASAESEFNLVRQIHESDPPLRQRIEMYWKELGFTFKSIDVPWSAVFISWNVLKAGATKANFSFDPRHSKFVHDTIVGTNSPPAFKGHRPDEYAPKVGDIIHNNRSGNSFDFDHARQNDDYESHSAIVVEVGAAMGGERFAITIGGNESDSVRRRRVALDASGKVIQKGNLFISILENVKA